MPAYSFKERFVPLILEQSKRQTIRSRRKYPPRVGQNAFLFYGMRTKNCKRLGQEPIKMVRSVRITETGIFIYCRTLDNIELEVAKINPLNISLPDGVTLIDTKDKFAWDDGFRVEGTTRENPKGAFDLMIRFWNQTHSLPFVGDLICW